MSDEAERRIVARPCAALVAGTQGAEMANMGQMTGEGEPKAMTVEPVETEEPTRSVIEPCGTVLRSHAIR